MKSYPKIIIALWLCCSFSVFAEKVAITDLRVIHKPHHWQFVFETIAPVTFTQQQTKDGKTAIFDLPNAKLRKMFGPGYYASTPVIKLHMRHHGNTLRMILDLDHKVNVTAFTLKPQQKYPNRFVIDIKGQQLVTHGLLPPIKKAYKQQIAPFLLRPILTTKTLFVKRAPEVIVVIDPGHGGKDPGAMGRNGVHEKDVVLAISKQLQHNINNVPGFKAILTRYRDNFIPLRGRLAIARQNKADMFIAIHADAYRNRHAHGVSVFALSQRGATSEAARWLADRENKSELMGGVDLNDKSHMLKSVLINLSQMATVRMSLQIGEALVHNIGRFAHLHHGMRVEQAAFVVLKSPDIPSLLVETGFISNAFEARRLTSKPYQIRLAKAITGGIVNYFEGQPPRGTKLAQRLHNRHTI